MISINFIFVSEIIMFAYLYWFQRKFWADIRVSGALLDARPFWLLKTKHSHGDHVQEQKNWDLNPIFDPIILYLGRFFFSKSVLTIDSLSSMAMLSFETKNTKSLAQGTCFIFISVKVLLNCQNIMDVILNEKHEKFRQGDIGNNIRDELIPTAC